MTRKATAIIRRAVRADLKAMGRLGAALARVHHDWDPQRFFMWDGIAEGYAWWLGKELKNKQAVLLVAERRRRVVGYAYGRVEPRDWNLLRERCAVGIDLIVEPSARGDGVGPRLGIELMRALQAKGAPRIVLQAAAKNRSAQQLFKRMGFRPTLIEMTRELDGPID
jgi:ribosomal protein S18 acetylase RimI-like enzyme